jgi:pimeloyl-ACP methyl ester carboxylesterase
MFINVEGIETNYKITGPDAAGGMPGDAPGAKPDTLVILQGWGTDMTIYDSVAEALSDRMRVVQFDLPGFGRTPEPPEAWPVARYAEWFLHFLEVLNIRRTSLMGHSYGGRIIIELASREELPFQIDKLLLVDSAGVMPQRSSQQKWKVKKYKMLKKLAGLKLSQVLCPQLIEEWQSRQGSADYRNATPLMRNALVMAVNYDQTPLLSSIKQETLLVWGDLDTATPLSDGETMDRLIPDSGLAIIKGTGHYSFLERRDVFQKILEVYFPADDGDAVGAGATTEDGVTEDAATEEESE